MRLMPLLFAMFAAGPSLAQNAVEDPCALTLFHLDRSVEVNESSGQPYRQDVLSMVAVAASSDGVGWEEALARVRAACAHNPDRAFVEIVASVIDTAHTVQANRLRVQTRRLEKELEKHRTTAASCSSNAALREAQERSRSLWEIVKKERETIVALRARISELTAKQ